MPFKVQNIGARRHVPLGVEAKTPGVPQFRNENQLLD